MSKFTLTIKIYVLCIKSALKSANSSGNNPKIHKYLINKSVFGICELTAKEFPQAKLLLEA